MPLRLITGRANTGKTSLVRSELLCAVADGLLPTLLLPTLPDVRRAREWLADDLPVGVQVDQFQRFVEGLWAVHGDGRRFISEAARLALVRAAGDETGPGQGLSAGAGFVRFVAAVARRLAEEPQWVFDQAECEKPADEAVLRIARDYVKTATAEGFIEPGAALRSFADVPPALEGPVVVHDFADLGVAQEALLLAWAEAGVRVTVTLSWEEAFAPTEALTGLVGRLRERADEVVALQVPERTDVDPELARLEASLFGSPDPRRGEGAVLFSAVAGPEAEAIAVARHAAKLAASCGDADRVAIVFRDTAAHVDRLRVALAGVGLAADFDVRTPFRATPFGSALLHLLRFQTTGSRAELAAFLRGPFSAASPVDVDRLERRWRMRRETEPRILAASARGLGETVSEALRLSRSICGKQLVRSGVGEWKELGDALLAGAHACDELQGTVEGQADAAAHRAMVGAIEDIAEAGPARIETVLAALGDVMTSPVHAERPGHVQVTEAHRLRARRFDAVIVGGMTAAGFSAEGAASPAAEFVDRLLCIDRVRPQARERLLFYHVVTRARRNLVFVRQEKDAEGEAVTPSVLWEEALDLYRAPSADDERDMPEAAGPTDPAAGDTLDAGPTIEPGRDVLRRAAFAGETGVDLRVAHALGRAGDVRGELRDEETLRRLAARRVFTVTELERYAQCPYRWFYERVVRPVRIDAEIGPAEAGDLAHRVLRTVYERLEARTGSRRVLPPTLDDALVLAGEVFAEEAVPPRTPAPLTLAEEDDLAGVLRKVRDLVSADSSFLDGYEPIATELRFGREESDAVELGGFAVRGSIDRIDAGPAGLVIVDYKSGQAARASEFEKRRILQLPLYAAVAERLLERPVVAAFYRSLSTGDARGFFIEGAVPAEGLVRTDRLDDAGAVQELIDRGVGIAHDAAAGIRAGRIAPVEPPEGACEYCQAAPFCPGRCSS